MAEFIVEAINLLPRQFQPLTDRTLTCELRGTAVKTNRGHVGEICTAYEDHCGIRVFVRFPSATGWFPLSDLDPILEELCPTGPTTSLSTTPIETTAGSSSTATTTSSSTTTTVTTSTEPSCACVSCVVTLLSEI